jgi:hypothetical protein
MRRGITNGEVPLEAMLEEYIAVAEETITVPIQVLDQNETVLRQLAVKCVARPHGLVPLDGQRHYVVDQLPVGTKVFTRVCWPAVGSHPIRDTFQEVAHDGQLLNLYFDTPVKLNA